MAFCLLIGFLIYMMNALDKTVELYKLITSAITVSKCSRHFNQHQEMNRSQQVKMKKFLSTGKETKWKETHLKYLI